jgi:hypothetical protein
VLRDDVPAVLDEVAGEVVGDGPQLLPGARRDWAEQHMAQIQDHQLTG